MSTSKVGIGVIGFGYWGPNLVRNFSLTPDAEVRVVCDASAASRARCQAAYPTTRQVASADELISDPSIDAVVIATPVSSHFELAEKALLSGKHVMVEKPMTSTSDESKRLVELAAQKGLTLLVDHTFVYTGAVKKMRELVTTGELGEVLYYDSVRVNLGLFQSDVNVIWDLAPHDLSILAALVPGRPVSVSAEGARHVPGQPENTAYLTMHFEGSLIAHVHVNWLAPVKIRRTILGGSKRMVVYDDIEPTEKIKIYDRGVELTRVESDQERIKQMRVSYRSGDIWAPRLDESEALRVEAKHFVECVRDKKRPITDGEAGLRVVEILEAASVSLATGGRVHLVR
jgi:predicted dehydrogenase